MEEAAQQVEHKEQLSNQAKHQIKLLNKKRDKLMRVAIKLRLLE